MSDNAHDQPYENPYTAPASTPGLTQSVPTESTEEQHLRAFVGSKAEYYLEKWSPLVEHSGHSTGFNWAAFLQTSRRKAAAAGSHAKIGACILINRSREPSAQKDTRAIATHWPY